MICLCFWSEIIVIMDLVCRFLLYEMIFNKYIFLLLYWWFFSICFIWFCCLMYEFWLFDVMWFFGWFLRILLGLCFVWYILLCCFLLDIFWGRSFVLDMNLLCFLFECCCFLCLVLNWFCWIFGRVWVLLCFKLNEILFWWRFVLMFILKID